MKVAVISSDYPSPEFNYGDVFVHTRLKYYIKQLDVKVIGYNGMINADLQYSYEGISILITSDLSKFISELKSFNPDVIIGHFIQSIYIKSLIGLGKPLLIFVHGYEALSWKRRTMNYRTIGDYPYLFQYILSNRIQLKGMIELAQYSNQNKNVHFVFVSNWLRNAVERDWKISLINSHVIPNGIDINLFSYSEKQPETRKKILILRSFKAHNYANDLAIEAILLLSQRPFFKDLEFSIYGEGYLFASLTAQIKKFSNVRLYNNFVENKIIPVIHSLHGIFLCPSRLDTQGVSMCEAMSSGLVPITSAVGGIPEYAEDNKSSFQVSTPEEIAEKIEVLYWNPDLFLKMSAEARMAIEQKCSVFNTIPKEINLIEPLGDLLQKSSSIYLQCTRCILDTNDDPGIEFNEQGICSYCHSYEKNENKFIKTDASGLQELESIVTKIKDAGKGKQYDCIIGLSGGVDSTYLALKAKELGLRPLAVHFDNGWNSELAVNNIENIVNKLGFDLHTVVIDWEEFRDLQLAFLKASVVDIEIVTDQAIFASLYKLAIDLRVKYILSGVNFVTESILPSSWIHDKRDHVHVKAINKLFGKTKLHKYPLFNTRLKLQLRWRGITSISLLNYFPFVKADVKRVIEKELSWRDYGGKHYESVFTRFYQGYILPIKFGIDKRKAHLSNLINSGQITRDQALLELQAPAYPEEYKKRDFEFVLKKLRLSESEFQQIMQLPVKKHSDYPIDEDIYKRFPILLLLSPVWKLIKRVKGV